MSFCIHIIFKEILLILLYINLSYIYLDRYIIINNLFLIYFRNPVVDT